MLKIVSLVPWVNVLVAKQYKASSIIGSNHVRKTKFIPGTNYSHDNQILRSFNIRIDTSNMYY